MIKTACTAGYTVLQHVARLFTFVVYASAAAVYAYACSLLHNVHGLLYKLAYIRIMAGGPHVYFATVHELHNYHN